MHRFPGLMHERCFAGRHAGENDESAADASARMRRWKVSVILISAIMVVLGALLASATVHAQSCAGMSLGPQANLNGFVPFPASNLWNTNIANAPVDPASAAITSAAGFAGLGLHPDFGNGATFGYPYDIVDSTMTPVVPINVIDYAGESDVVAAPFPSNAPIEGAPDDCSYWPDAGGANSAPYDAHTLVIDRAKCVLYETWNTHRCNGQWNASSETMWDLNNYESRPYGWTSADAAGLPIFPGLVRYEEVASGAIKHAIRFTMAHTKNDHNNGYFVAPATHAAGNIWGVSNVMGMRIRLKASFDISGFSPTNQVILTAMKQYGMILADNGGYFFFQGVPDSRWDNSDLNQLKSVGSENFEVVQMNPGFPGYDAATAPSGPPPVINAFSASATTVSSGTPVTLTYSVADDSYDYIDVAGPVPSGSGSVTVNPTATQTYTLVATNAYGRVTSSPITVKVPGSVVAAPVFTPLPGSYSAAVTVSMTTPTSLAATIYYTTDGTQPTTKSAVFSMTDPITVASTETLKAIAVVDGYASASAVATGVYQVLPLAASPVFSPAAGTYNGAQKVSLSSATGGAAIYYTTDGSNPATSATAVLYTGPISAPRTLTINAVAEETGYTNSAVASAMYNILLPAAAAPVFSPAPGTYPGTQAVSITSMTPNALFAYTTDGSDPNTSPTRILYSGPIAVSSTETLSAFADAPGTTVNSPVTTGTYTITGGTEPTPVISPGTGTYTAAQTVTIRCAAPTATIYYTTDGTNPATSATASVYAGPIAVKQTETIEAVAKATGFTTSPVAIAGITINYPLAGTPVFSPSSGTYSGTQTVSITSATANARILYTTDGSNPATSATASVYSGPISVTKTTVLEAVAEAASYTNSAVGMDYLTITLPAASAPIFTPPAGHYASTQQVTLSSTTPNALFGYTTDGSNPTTSSTRIISAGPITVSSNLTISAFADAPGATTNSPVATASYLIGYSPASAPVFSLPAGTYTGAQTVTISSATPNAVIVYTTDGSNPTSSATAITYTGPVSIPRSALLSAFANAPGVTTNSAVSAAAYTINLPPASAPIFTPPPGTYSGTQMVTLSSATPNALFVYTTDGSNPATSTTRIISSVPIAVAGNMTIKALADAPGATTNSPVSTAVYVIAHP